jgi:hypothetical protein
MSNEIYNAFENLIRENHELRQQVHEQRAQPPVPVSDEVREAIYQLVVLGAPHHMLTETEVKHY